MSTGGIGCIYQTTTNPLVATEMVSQWYPRKGEIKGMEFVQFHPTALYHGDRPSFLISEAVRGYGDPEDERRKRIHA